VSRLALVSVNVGRPAYLGHFRGQPVVSGIAKEPVATRSLGLDRLNLEGDGQADLLVHGGVDKAVYAYPAVHLPRWSAEVGRDLDRPAAFGENLTIAAVDENDVRIGDRWRWGDAVLEVCQPRSPCFKLVMHTGVGDIQRRMRANGRCGWYLRVLVPGTVPVDGSIDVEPDPEGITVRDAHVAGSPSHDTPEDLEQVAAVAAHPALAAEWRDHLERRLARHGPRGERGAARGSGSAGA
jgi:MOSC domain-containing protein YiiM